ncbi:hypothetical protein ANN_13759 [Periplaneta americana]|uniref:Uncharacterized protein n=1 Tax=Periplaneta americana TaxID=6978 RepID=A0ABQ8SVS2_PERAM|nr:hypothetical protein ANN_13759 [Periplaneta americana]
MICCQEVKERIAMAKDTFNRKKEYFLRTSTKRTEDVTSGVLCMEYSLYGAETWTLRRSKDNRIEAFEKSRAVASRSKSSRLGLALRNARWFESSWGKKFSHENSASVWDRCPPSIVMHLGSYDRNYILLSVSYGTFRKFTKNLIEDDTMYVAKETVGKKGSDEMTLFLHHFIFNILDPKVKNLQLFYDGCGGEDKNYTVFRFFHYVVQAVRRLDCIKVTFSVRGHSYLQCDRNMALIKQKCPAELPEHWIEIF